MTQRRKVVALGVVLILVVVLSGAAGWLVASVRSAQRDDAAATARTEKDKAGTVKEQVDQVVDDCKPDPNTRACKRAVDDAEAVTKGIDTPTPAGLSASQRAEVIVLAAEIARGDPAPSLQDVIDGVLDQIRVPRDGKPGAPGVKGDTGPTGADGETPAIEAIRLLVEQVYAANPPAPGKDGTPGKDGANGATGSTGSTGSAGKDGSEGARGASCVEELGLEACRGDKGERGDTGAPGRDGADSTVPGPSGPAGPAGPACPDGYTGQTLTVLTLDGGPRELFACVPAPAEPPPATRS